MRKYILAILSASVLVASIQSAEARFGAVSTTSMAMRSSSMSLTSTTNLIIATAVISSIAASENLKEAVREENDAKAVKLMVEEWKTAASPAKILSRCSAVYAKERCERMWTAWQESLATGYFADEPPWLPGQMLEDQARSCDVDPYVPDALCIEERDAFLLASASEYFSGVEEKSAFSNIVRTCATDALLDSGVCKEAAEARGEVLDAKQREVMVISIFGIVLISGIVVVLAMGFRT